MNISFHNSDTVDTGSFPKSATSVDISYLHSLISCSTDFLYGKNLMGSIISSNIVNK